MAKEDNEDRGFQEIDLANPGKVNLDELEAVNAAQETRRTIQSGSNLNDREDDDDDDTPNVVFTDDDEEPEEAPKKVKIPDEEKLKKRTSRAATRIQKLANEKNLARQEAEKERRMRLAAEDALRRQAAQSAQATERLLSARLQDLKRQQLSAMENGDNTAVVNISEAIAQANLDLNVVRRQTANIPPARRGPPPMQQMPQQYAQPVNIPEAAVQWGQENPWFDNPTNIDEAIKADAVKRFALQLVNQGEDPNDPDFFDQIDEEIERRFPAGQTQESTKESAPAQKSQNAPVVGGNPRGHPVVRTRPGKKTYRLTADDKQRIDELGITPQQYVKNLQQYEKTEGGWTEIAY